MVERVEERYRGGLSMLEHVVPTGDRFVATSTSASSIPARKEFIKSNPVIDPWDYGRYQLEGNNRWAGWYAITLHSARSQAKPRFMANS